MTGFCIFFLSPLLRSFIGLGLFLLEFQPKVLSVLEILRNWKQLGWRQFGHEKETVYSFPILPHSRSFMLEYYFFISWWMRLFIEDFVLQQGHSAEELRANIAGRDVADVVWKVLNHIWASSDDDHGDHDFDDDANKLSRANWSICCAGQWSHDDDDWIFWSQTGQSFQYIQRLYHKIEPYGSFGTINALITLLACYIKFLKIRAHVEMWEISWEEQMSIGLLEMVRKRLACLDVS